MDFGKLLIFVFDRRVYFSELFFAASGLALFFPFPKWLEPFHKQLLIDHGGLLFGVFTICAAAIGLNLLSGIWSWVKRRRIAEYVFFLTAGERAVINSIYKSGAETVPLCVDLKTVISLEKNHFIIPQTSLCRREILPPAFRFGIGDEPVRVSDYSLTVEAKTLIESLKGDYIMFNS